MLTPSIADTYFSIPELMRVARGSYKRAIDTQLAAGEIDDLPRSGGFILAYLANGEESIPEMLGGLGSHTRRSASSWTPWPCAGMSLAMSI